MSTITVVRRRAQSLLREVGIHQVPVDVFAVTTHLGLDVLAEALDSSTSGVLVVGVEHAVIGVNQHHHRRRQRFTIAHELAHYVLHRHASNVFVDSTLTFHRNKTSAEGVDRQEVEANAFAAELLMPEGLLKQYWEAQQLDLYDDVALARLAARFDVSEQALTIRLMNLRLVEG